MGWITLHAEDSDEGTVHVFLGGGGQVEKGPKSLIGANIHHLSQHARVEHRKSEPKAAKQHPTYTEHQGERTVHVYGRKGPGVGYDVTVHEPPPQLTQEQAHAGLREAVRHVKPDAHTTTPVPIPEGPKSLEYSPHAQDQESLSRIDALQGRSAQLGDIAVSTPTYGQSNRLSIKRVNAERGIVHDEVSSLSKQIAQQQYDRLDAEGKASLASSLDAKGKIDALQAGHATPDQVNTILRMFHRLPEEKHLNFLSFLHHEAGKNDPFNGGSGQFSPMAYAVAAHTIRTHMLGGEEPEDVPSPTAAPSTPQPVEGGVLPEGAKAFAPDAPTVTESGQYRNHRMHLATRPLEGGGMAKVHIHEEAPGSNTYKVFSDAEYGAPEHVANQRTYGTDLPLRDAKKAAMHLLSTSAGTHHGHVVLPHELVAPPAATPLQDATSHGQLDGQTILPGFQPGTPAGAPATQGGLPGMPEHTDAPGKQRAELPGQSGMFKPAMGGSALTANPQHVADSTKPVKHTAAQQAALRDVQRLTDSAGLDPLKHAAKVSSAVEKAHQAAQSELQARRNGDKSSGPAWAQRIAHREASNAYASAANTLQRKLDAFNGTAAVGGMADQVRRTTDQALGHALKGSPAYSTEAYDAAQHLSTRYGQSIGHYHDAITLLRQKAEEHRNAAEAIDINQPSNRRMTASRSVWERATDMTHALFRKWTAEDRSRAPDDVFCGPGKTFPLSDQDDLNSIAHLIGKAKNPDAIKAKAIARAHKLGLKLPDAWQTTPTANNSADFGLSVDSRRVEGDFAIYPNAVLWRAGDYTAAKQYAMSPEDNWLAVEQFTPVFGNIEHSSFMKGRACEVRSIRMDDDDPHILRGEVAVPLGLDGLLGPLEKRLSCEWDRATKRLKGIALTTNPFIPEAVLMSATAHFNAQHDTPSGQAVMQLLHDAAAEHGAVCSQRNANMHSRHEHKALQDVHDTCVAHGATCMAMPTGSMAQPMAAMNNPGRTSTMRNPFKEWFALGRDARELARDAGADVPDEALFSVVENEAEEARRLASESEVARLQSQRADLQRELAEAREAKFAAEAQRMQGEAAAFADGLVAGNKLYPAERESLITLLTQQAMDDARHGAATFSTGGTPTSRVEQTKALYLARPAHVLTQEQIKEAAKGGKVLFNTTETKDLKPNEADYSVEDLLAKTDAGRTAITLKNGRG